MRGPGMDACLHGLEVEVSEGRLEPCDVSDLHAAERSGGGEPAKPRAGACEPTQSTAESDPDLRVSLSGLDGLSEGALSWLPALAFAFAILAHRDVAENVRVWTPKSQRLENNARWGPSLV
jgi:hypothetical protein